jgi:hypothetical protein
MTTPYYLNSLRENYNVIQLSRDLRIANLEPCNYYIIERRDRESGSNDDLFLGYYLGRTKNDDTLVFNRDLETLQVCNHIQYDHEEDRSFVFNDESQEYINSIAHNENVTFIKPNNNNLFTLIQLELKSEEEQEEYRKEENRLKEEQTGGKVLHSKTRSKRRSKKHSKRHSKRRSKKHSKSSSKRRKS